MTNRISSCGTILCTFLSAGLILQAIEARAQNTNCEADYTPLPGVAYDAEHITIGPCTAKLSQRTTCSGHRVVFTVGSCTSSTKKIWAVGFGDGLHVVNPGDQFEISYAATGEYEIEVLMEDRSDPYEPTSYLRSLAFEVTGLTYRDADLTLTVEGTYDGETYYGDAYIYRTSPGAPIYNPVIVTDGFDPGSKRGIRCLYSLFNRHNFLEEALRQGRTIVLLDFQSGDGPIQGNAMVLVDLIQEINSMKSGLSPLAVVGPSMGGLVARYALTYMESNGMEHDTALYLSFDTPHNGANIPVGLQLWVAYFSRNSDGAAEGLKALNSEAARQMLLYHAYQHAHVAPVFAEDLGVLLAPGAELVRTISSPVPHEDFDAFFNELSALGGFPHRPRKVAIANGSGFGRLQPATFGQRILNYRYLSTNVDIKGNSFATQNSSQTTKLFEGKIDPIGMAKDRFVLKATSAVGYDSAPGGQRATSFEIAEARPGLGDIVSESDAECFIPTTSALALDTTDPFYNIAGDPEIMSKTPFDAIYYPIENEEHVCVTPWNMEWALDEMHYVDAYRAALLVAVLPWS